MVFLVFLGLELDIDVHRSGETSKEGANLVLNISMVTMNN